MVDPHVRRLYNSITTPPAVTKTHNLRYVSCEQQYPLNALFSECSLFTRHLGDQGV